jgi:hypothetical protein
LFEARSFEPQVQQHDWVKIPRLTPVQGCCASTGGAIMLFAAAAALMAALFCVLSGFFRERENGEIQGTLSESSFRP